MNEYQLQMQADIANAETTKAKRKREREYSAHRTHAQEIMFDLELRRAGKSVTDQILDEVLQ